MKFGFPFSRGPDRYLTNDQFTIPPGVVQAQGLGDMVENTSDIDTLMSGPFEPLIPATNHITSKVCFGEESTNFLDLLHRYQIWGTLTMANETPYTFYSPGYVQWQVGPPSRVALLDTTIGFMNSIALFQRGGQNYKILKNWNSTNSAVREGRLMGYPWTFGNVSDKTNIMGRGGFVIEDMHIHPQLDVSLPYYSKAPYRQNQEVCVFEGEEEQSLGLWWTSYETSGPSLPVLILGAVKDDKSFGWLRGYPILTYITGAEQDSDNNNDLKPQSSLRAIALSNTTFSLDTNNKNNKKQ